MGPKAQQAQADYQRASLEMQRHVLTELRYQRAVQAKISARLGIEVEDREREDDALGVRVLEHEREINRLKLVKNCPAE